MNNVSIIGNITRDPELRFAAGSGTAVLRFTVAVPRQFKRDETDFINCVAFGKTAETISQYFTKGSEIAIVGSIRTGSYDAQDGTKRYTTDVTVDSFNFTKGSNGKKSEGPTPNDNKNKEVYTGEFDITPVDDGDMPF